MKTPTHTVTLVTYFDSQGIRLQEPCDVKREVRFEGSLWECQKLRRLSASGAKLEKKYGNGAFYSIDVYFSQDSKDLIQQNAEFHLSILR